MNLLVTDLMGAWEVAPSAKRLLPYDCPNASQPCAAPGLRAFACEGLRECVCLTNAGEMISRMPCAPGILGMAFSSCGRYLYQLGGDADSIHTRLTATGELLFAAPAGVFPRMMKKRDRHLIVAGGAIGEAYVFTAPELTVERVIHLKHPCFAADAWQDGLVLVCATEGEDIHTAVYTVKNRGVRPRLLLMLPGIPSALCVCPDGSHAILSTGDGLMKINLWDGTVLWNRPEWMLTMKIECLGHQALLSGTLNGSVVMLHHAYPWRQQVLFQGEEAQACIVG